MKILFLILLVQINSKFQPSKWILKHVGGLLATDFIMDKGKKHIDNVSSKMKAFYTKILSKIDFKLTNDIGIGPKSHKYINWAKNYWREIEKTKYENQLLRSQVENNFFELQNQLKGFSDKMNVKLDFLKKIAYSDNIVEIHNMIKQQRSSKQQNDNKKEQNFEKKLEQELEEFRKEIKVI